MNRFFKNLFFIIALIVPLATFAQAPKGAPFPGISDAEMKQLEAEMAAFQKEIEALSPQEQESFFKSMEQAVKRIDDLSKTDEGKELLEKLDKGEISDAELDQLINQIVEEEPSAPTQKPQEQPKPTEVKKPEPKVVKQISSAEQQAIDLINDIIHHSNSFIIKAGIMPELPGKIAAWRKKSQIDWQPNLSWNTLKRDLESFVEILNKLIEQNSTTKEYIHLDKLLKNESLYNNIKKVHRIIAQHEPVIEEVLPLNGKINKASKKAFQKMINQYVEALYLLALPQEIKQLMTHYEPTAKQLREFEEKSRKQADAGGRRRMRPGAPIVLGTEDVDYGPSPVDYGDYDRSYRPARSNGRSSQPSSYSSFGQPSSTDKKSAAQGAKRAGGKKGKAAQEDELEDEDTQEEKGKDEPKDKKLEELLKQAEKIDATMFAEADRLLDRVAANLEVAAQSIKDSKLLQNVGDTIRADSPIDVVFATEILPDLIRELSLRKGAIGNIKQLETRLTPVAQTKYKKKLQELYAKYKKQIDGLLDQLENIGDDAYEKMGVEKRYAYFAQEPEMPEVEEQNIDEILKQVEAASTSLDEGLASAVSAIKAPTPTEDPLKEIKGKIPTPYSLNELKDTIKQLKSEIEQFGKTKPAAQKKGK